MSPKLYTTGDNGKVEQWKITTMMTNTTMATNGLISEYMYGSGMAPVDGSIMAPVDGSIMAPVDGSIMAPMDGSVVGPMEGSMVRPMDGSMVGPMEISTEM